MIVLDTVREGNTIPLRVSARDENDAAITPLTAAWTLRDTAGAIVNGRSAVAITPALSMLIMLTPADLVYDAETGISRVLSVSMTYTSIYGGTGTIVEDYLIPIDPAAGKAWGL